MQSSAEIAYVMNDKTQYIMIPSIKYAIGIGTYVSYDIAAYDCFNRSITEVVLDATSDRDTALFMCEKFNRYRLAPCQLEDAILDIIS